MFAWWWSCGDFRRPPVVVCTVDVHASRNIAYPIHSRRFLFYCANRASLPPHTGRHTRLNGLVRVVVASRVFFFTVCSLGVVFRLSQVVGEFVTKIRANASPSIKLLPQAAAMLCEPPQASCIFPPRVFGHRLFVSGGREFLAA